MYKNNVIDNYSLVIQNHSKFYQIWHKFFSFLEHDHYKGACRLNHPLNSSTIYEIRTHRINYFHTSLTTNQLIIFIYRNFCIIENGKS